MMMLSQRNSRRARRGLTGYLAGLALALGTVDGASAANLVYVPNLTSNNTVSVIDQSSNQVVATVAVGHYPARVAISPNGSLVYVANIGDNTVSVINTMTQAVSATISVPNGATALIVSPDNTRVYVSGANAGAYYISEINTSTNSVVASSQMPMDIAQGLAITPDGKTVYAGSTTGKVAVIDTATLTLTTAISADAAVNDLRISLDGTRVYFSSSQHVQVINTATNAQLADVSVGPWSSPLILRTRDTP